MHKYNPEKPLFFNWIKKKKKKKGNKQCLLDISAFAKFDEIQSLHVQVIKENTNSRIGP